jgi:hypothetical protein
MRCMDCKHFVAQTEAFGICTNSDYLDSNDDDAIVDNNYYCSRFEAVGEVNWNATTPSTML